MHASRNWGAIIRSSSFFKSDALLNALAGVLVVSSVATAAANNPPDVPVNYWPPRGQIGEPLCTYLQWGGTDPDGDALTYDVYFGPTSPPPLISSNQTSNVHVLPGLQTATTYRWRIVVRDEHGAETSGDEWVFTTKSTNGPPTVPASPNPANIATNQLVTGVLRWFSHDHDNFCDLTFDIYFGTNPSPPHIATVVDQLTYDVGTLNFLTTYYWQIIARDHLGVETVGPVWSFSTKGNSAPNVSQPHPVNGGAGGTSTLVTWSAIDVDEQPMTHFVYFGPNSPPPLVATNLTEPTFDPGLLQSGVTYYWQVVSYDGQLFSSSPIWSFVARIPGDVVPDNTLTAEDAACAMQVFFVNADCGGSGASLTADANCDGYVTPGDARCIHREAIGLGCDICQDAVAPVAPQEPSTAPVVSLSYWSINGNTLIVRLVADATTSFNAFGLYTWGSPSVVLAEAVQRGSSNNFDVWEQRQVSSQFTYVGGYALANQSAGPDAEFIELRYDISGGMPNSIAIDGFVDDLAGANQVYVDLNLVAADRIPTVLALHQNFPNPFNPQTTIAYDLPTTTTTERVRLRVVDVSGRVVRTLVDEDQPGGSYRVRWEGKNDRDEVVSSGIYFSVLDARGSRQTRKLVLLK